MPLYYLKQKKNSSTLHFSIFFSLYISHPYFLLLPPYLTFPWQIAHVRCTKKKMFEPIHKLLGNDLVHDIIFFCQGVKKYLTIGVKNLRIRVQNLWRRKKTNLIININNYWYWPFQRKKYNFFKKMGIQFKNRLIKT